ncbi:MAG: adenylosuccinate lyase [Rickettsiaceae bacterium H1]|nr:adenylosuccinate lyase [Rickettsiaceae bacterium H1]
MIPRYSCSSLTKVWDESNKLAIWLEIELLACEAQAKLGNISYDSLEKIKRDSSFDLKRIAEIENVTKHDVIAFLTNISEHVGPDGRLIHYGMTSSDILDTCLSVQLVRSVEVLLDDIRDLLEILKKKAKETKHITCIGRSHGIHAEPMSFGLKFARFYSEFKRNYDRLLNAKSEIAMCAISGPVGNFSNIDPFVEKYVANAMGLAIEPISTQVIPRDRHAMLFAVFAIIAGSIENVATEIRNLQKTEVREVEEFFSGGQKGSSSMPHKKNPIFSENLTGLARIIRSYSIPAFENVALWHERDISHSSVERFIAPDACITLDFALNRLCELVKNLVIYPENINKNLHRLQGLFFSQKVLLYLIKQGLSREDAYKIVQGNAMKAWDEKVDFIDALKQDEKLQKYQAELDNLLDINSYNIHLDEIFTRVFNL